jgi:FkbM family methyltransferase
VLKAFVAEVPEVRFVQIGSNDAAQDDPIMSWALGYGWQGLLVEPVPYVYERLKLRHGRNPRLRTECTAVGNEEGVKTFYYLEQLEGEAPRFYDCMGSFSREVIVKHERFHPGLSQHIREMQVPCTTLTTLLRKHGIARFDLLHIDTEGYDFEVLKSLDFATSTPGMVLFEYVHLSRADRAVCAAFLEDKGYRLMYEGRDCMGLHHSVRGRWPETAAMFDAYSAAA